MPAWLTIWLVLELIGTGVAAGLVGGMLGVGGGIIMIPALTLLLGADEHGLFGVEGFHVYKLGAIATSMLLSLPAIQRHRRARAIVPALVKSIVPLAVIGVVVGVVLTRQFSRDDTITLRKIFGGFLLAVAAFNLAQQWWLGERADALQRSCPSGRRAWLYGLVVGSPAGFLAGLLGIGGGVWAVPVQRMGFGVRLQNAIANSAVAILPIAAMTTVMMSWRVATADTNISVWAGYLIAACLTPGALVGAWFGAGLTHRLPVQTLRAAFQILLAVAGWRLLTG